MTFGLISLIGFALFLWPVVAGNAPSATAALAVIAGVMVLLICSELSLRRLDARQMALLMAIAALDSALRAAMVSGFFGFSPVFFLVLCAGYIYGAKFGFLCGSLTMLISGVVTGGVGPWLPYEMFGVGWVGAAAGLVPRRYHASVNSQDVIILAILGMISGWLYGAALDLWDWTFFYRGAPDFGWMPGLPATQLAGRFAKFYFTTSFVWDSARSAGNAVMIILMGKPVLSMLQRLRLRFTLTIIPASIALRGVAHWQSHDDALHHANS